MRDLVLEIGTEELPAAWLQPMLAQLAAAVVEPLRREGIVFQAARCLGTPYRLAIYWRAVAPRQPDTVIEVRGPAARQAFDAEGNYTSAAFGFARSQEIFPEELKVKRVSGGEYLFVERPRPGLPTEQVAARLFAEAVATLAFPKRMRREDGGAGRPIRWLLCLYGDDVVSFAVDGLTSDRHTRGHRALSPESIPVAAAEAYLSTLAQARVMVDPAERRERVRRQVEALARLENAAPREPDLLDEVADGVEYPTAFAGELAPCYLALPREALGLVLGKQQRCFALTDASGALLPRFIGVHDGGEEGLNAARAEREAVLRARLTELCSNYEEDRRIALAARLEALHEIAFHEQLGTMRQKSERLVSLCAFIAAAWEMEPTARRSLERAALLAKADLATALVKDLPELGGILGRHFALEGGEPESVAEAIAGQYLPRAAGDPLPIGVVARVLAIADRLDTLVGFFGIGLVPVGSQDPHALWGQATGLVSLLLESPSLSLGTLIGQGYALYDVRADSWRSLEVVRASLLDFLRLRLESSLSERGIRHDTADAVLDAGFEDLAAVLARARALETAREQPEFAPTLEAAVRMGTLLRFAARSGMAAPPGETRMDLLEEEAEAELYGAYLEILPQVEQATREGDYARVLELLQGLAAPLDAFFDTVLVMSDDEVPRNNRLLLLAEIHSLFLRVADLTRLAGDAASS